MKIPKSMQFIAANKTRTLYALQMRCADCNNVLFTQELLQIMV